MPYCKQLAVHNNVKQTLTYILNPDKTDERILTASINCMTEPEFAYTQMKAVYEQFAKRSYDSPKQKNGKSSVKAIHLIMSFADSENVSPELALKIGKAFVRKMFGDDAQAVIATHINAEHIHNHILINSYSLSGKRFYENQTTLRQARETANGVCRAFGVTPALNFENKGRSISYYEWQHKKKGTSWKEHIRQAIDSLIPAVYSIDDLLSELERKGFSVKRDKHIYIKAPGQKRSVSLWTLGEDYIEESLNARILWRMVGGGNAIEHFSNTDIEHAYISVIGEVKILAEQNKKIKRRRDTNALYSPKNDLDIYRLSAQLTIINRDSIASIGDLEGRIDRLSAEHNAMQEQLSEKLLKQEKVQELVRQSEYYFAKVERNDLSAEENNRLEICKYSMQANEIVSPDDIIAWRERNDKLLFEIAELKNSIYKKKNRLAMYVDIRDTYKEISQGDYISKLVEEEKLRKELEQKKQPHKKKHNR
ncbi:MAG: relaxase/mobilization nuclease domain-containing protein [Ruminococcus sp.]|nr:relaxase/mobilization nuclease domain-containing protein [Ruminococcus sp.]